MKKEKTQIGIRLDNDMYEKISGIADDFKITKVHLIEQLVCDFLNNSDLQFIYSLLNNSKPINHKAAFMYSQLLLMQKFGSGLNDESKKQFKEASIKLANELSAEAENGFRNKIDI